MLSREQIDKRPGFTVAEVRIDEWNDTVGIRSWTAKERGEYAVWIKKNPDATDLEASARVAAMSLCDANGVRLYSDADVPALLEQSAAALDKVVAAALTHNGIGEDSVKSAEKNSETTS